MGTEKLSPQRELDSTRTTRILAETCMRGGCVPPRCYTYPVAPSCRALPRQATRLPMLGANSARENQPTINLLTGRYP